MKIVIFLLLVVSQANHLKRRGDEFSNIKKLVLEGNLKGEAYNELAYIVDTFGPRLWGSKQMDLATAHLEKYLKKNQIEYTKEAVDTPVWIRGEEKLVLHDPREVPTKLNVIGLGGTVAGEMKSEVVIIKTFEELKNATKNQLKGKIVALCASWTDIETAGSAEEPSADRYEHLSPGRIDGPSIAASKGAIGYLIKSIASDSVESPHTGVVIYDEKQPKIPAAAISVEDGEMFERMHKRKQKIVVELKLSGHTLKEHKNTYNIIAEIKGSSKPDEIVLMGGHWDSWDTGSQTGANDDGAGVMVCLQALRALKKLNLKPTRTIRFIAWAGEEFANDKLSGYAVYHKLHKKEHHFVAFESDLGVTKFKGMGFKGKDFSRIKEEASKKLPEYSFISSDFVPVDVDPLGQDGVNTMFNIVQDEPDKGYYFKYHHSGGDSMSMLDSADMDSNVAGIASFIYLIANVK